MKLSRADLDWAEGQGLLQPGQAEPLWRGLSAHLADQPRLDLAHVAYYLGAFMVMAALGWLLNDAWEALGGLGLAVTAALYALVFIMLGRRLWFGRGPGAPGGLMFTLAVWMAPLFTFGLQDAAGAWTGADPGAYAGYYQWIKEGWCLMEVSTILAAGLALRFVRFPFLTFPLALAMWFMSMDLTPLLFGPLQGSDHEAWFHLRKLVSMGWGGLMLLVAFLIDRRTRADYAFWLYLFGLAAFWGGLSLLNSDSELGKVLYALINLGLILLAVWLQRRGFVVFGAVGFFGYLGHLAWEVFADTLGFTLATTVLGVLLILGGVWYQRRAARIAAWARGLLPAFLWRLSPVNRG